MTHHGIMCQSILRTIDRSISVVYAMLTGNLTTLEYRFKRIASSEESFHLTTVHAYIHSS